jgi:hypothetical protein
MKLTKYFLITSLFIAGVVTAGCGGGSNNNSAPTTAYTMSNGYCYSGSTVVPTTYCQQAGVTGVGVGGGGYTVINGQCYSGGVPVPNGACANGGYGNAGYFPPAPMPPVGYPYYPYAPYPPYPYYGGGGGIFIGANLH